MKIKEIIENPPRDEYIQDYKKYFTEVDVIIPDFHQKHFLSTPCNFNKVDKEGDIYYGLFTKDSDELISILIIVPYEEFYKVELIATERTHRNQGLIRLLFDYAVKTDGLNILSDTHQSPEAKSLWLSFLKYRLFNIFIYSLSEKTIYEANIKDGSIRRKTDGADPYSKEFELDLLLLAKNKNSNTLESELNKINEGRKIRKISFYGPEMNAGDYP